MRHWGIGSQFLKVEYPFIRYNLFYYVYVLSFFEAARGDASLEEALAQLETSVDDDGRVVVAAPHRGLKGLDFCARGEASVAAGRRWGEIRANVGES